MPVLIQSYNESNVDADQTMQVVDPSVGVQNSRQGLAFQTPISTQYTLTSFKLWLKKTGLPTGTARGVLFAATGTIETAEPTGAELAGVDFDISTLTTSYALYEFIFTTPYTSLANTTYTVYLRNPTSGTIDASNYPSMGVKETGTGNGINQVRYANGWITNTRAPAYYLYGNIVGSGGGNFRFL